MDHNREREPFTPKTRWWIQVGLNMFALIVGILGGIGYNAHENQIEVNRINGDLSACQTNLENSTVQVNDIKKQLIQCQQINTVNISNTGDVQTITGYKSEMNVSN